MTSVLATAADASYGYHALNLVGSVLRNSDIFDRIEVFDLGLTEGQRTLLAAAPRVELRPVPAFTPHWAQCFTWKPWGWMQLEADHVFWLDSGATVLRSLEPALAQIAELGYFVVSQGNELSDIVPPDYFDLYGVPASYASRPYVAAGIIGFAPGGDFFGRVLVPTYQDVLAGRNLGYSADEVDGKNRGIGWMDSPPIRDCLHFRWDQTLLNIHLALELPAAKVADLDEYAGWRSPRDHPRQVIWSHRACGDLAYLKRVPYAGDHALRRRLLGAWIQLRWWVKLNDRYLAGSTYRLKLRRLLRALPPAGSRSTPT
jgi:hypothetical protein